MSRRIVQDLSAGAPARRGIVTGWLVATAFAGVAPAIAAGEIASVARLRHAEGTVAVVRSDRGPAAPALPNQPLFKGDRLRTADGRAEIELADASVIWIDRESVVLLSSLGDAGAESGGAVIDLPEGRIQFEAAGPGRQDASTRIEGAAASIYLISAGFFRIESRRGLTSLASYRGLAEISGEDGAVLVRSGQRSVAPAGGAPMEPRRQSRNRHDPFDDYIDRRSEVLGMRGDDPGRVDRDVLPSPIVPFVEELSRFGTWETMASIGPVWRPHQSGSWSPFLRGRWRATAAGWFWISEESWGWAPYRYGRWDQRIGRGWFWIPGSVWGTAWVAFAVGPAHVGWCPLDYWNQPVVQGGAATATMSARRLDPRAWVFVPTERFAQPIQPHAVVRGDRLPRSTQYVLTRDLPDFDPARIGTMPDGGARLMDQSRRAALPPPSGAGGRTASFRSEELRAGADTAGQGGARRSGSPARPRAAEPPVARQPRNSTPAPADGRRGHAIEQLVRGTHADPAGTAPPLPDRAGTQAPPPKPRVKPRKPGSKPAKTIPDLPPPLPPPASEPPEDRPR